MSESEVFKCRCKETMHVMFVEKHDWGDGDIDYTFTLSTDDLPWYMRLRWSWAYVFKNVRYTWGPWGAILLSPEEATRLNGWLRWKLPATVRVIEPKDGEFTITS